MLSVLILRPGNAFDLAVSLHDLVAGAVDGLVREVVLVGASDGEVVSVGEHAGCRMVADAEFLRPDFALKGDWLLVVAPGERLPGGWIETAARHMGQGGGQTPGRFAALEHRPFWRRWKPARTAAWLLPTGAAMERMRASNRVEASLEGPRARRLVPDPPR